MTIYKVTSKRPMPKYSFYFEEQRTAEACIECMDALLVDKAKGKWDCEIIEVLSHEQAGELMLQFGKMTLNP